MEIVSHIGHLKQSYWSLACIEWFPILCFDGLCVLAVCLWVPDTTRSLDVFWDGDIGMAHISKTRS